MFLLYKAIKYTAESCKTMKNITCCFLRYMTLINRVYRNMQYRYISVT